MFRNERSARGMRRHEAGCAADNEVLVDAGENSARARHISIIGYRTVNDSTPGASTFTSFVVAPSCAMTRHDCK
jgi:hypothetical protein